MPLRGFRILRVYETIDGERVDFDNMNAHPGAEHQQKVGDLCSKYHFKEVLWPTNCRIHSESSWGGGPPIKGKGRNIQVTLPETNSKST